MKKICLFISLCLASFIATAATPIETLKINQALWGADISNSVKFIGVAYDAKSDVIFTAGMKSHYLNVTKPDADHPFKAIDLEIATESQTSSLVVDSVRRNLFWINNMTEELRVINLDTYAITAKKAATPSGNTQDHYPVKNAVLDPETGWVWVTNSSTKKLTGYSPDLTQTLVAPDLQGPMSLAYHPIKKIFYVTDSPNRDQMSLKTFSSSTKLTALLLDSTKFVGASGRPPKKILILEDGSLLTVGQNVTRLDNGLIQKWSLPIKGQISEAALVGSTLAILMRDSGNELGDSFSRVTLIDTATGQELTTLSVRFEAQNLAANPEHNRLFVGNGGDGSVSVIDVNQKIVTKTIDVANAAEGLVVDTKTGTRYILNRLGGSEVYAWPKDSQALTRMDGGKWPSELAIDVDRRTLIALSHYESALYLWNLDNPATRETFSLGVAHNTGDSLGDLAYDADTGTAAVIFPESGNVVVADVANKKIVWTTNIPELKVGANAGPGGAEIAVDGTKNQIYIYDSKGAAVRAYNFTSGQLVATIALGAIPQQKPALSEQQGQRPPKQNGMKPDMQRPPNKQNRPPKGDGTLPPKQLGQQGQQKPPRAQDQQQRGQKPVAKSDYAINTTCLDKKRGLLFAGPFVINTNTLTLKSTLVGVDKIFYADSKIILGMKENKQTKQEEVVVLSPATFAETKRFSAIETHPIKSCQTYDPLTGLLYLSNLQPATVVVFDLKGII